MKDTCDHCGQYREITHVNTQGAYCSLSCNQCANEVIAAREPKWRYESTQVYYAYPIVSMIGPKLNYT